MTRTVVARAALVLGGWAGAVATILALFGQGAAPAPATAPAVTVYVAKSGHDSAPGTRAAPLLTISAAIRKAPSDGVVVVGSGSYHESLTLDGRSHVTVRSAAGATVWLDGSRAVTTWTRSGTRWVAGGWTARFDASPTFTAGAPDGTATSWTFVDPAHPMAAHPDQVWIDSVPQRQVATVAAVRPGSFYVDYASKRLYLGSNPEGRSVRASDLAKAISVRDPGSTISGINVRRFAPSVPMMGAVTVERPDVTLSDMQIADNATTALQVGSPGARLTDLDLTRNGMIGLLANHADGLRVDHLVVTRNNLERFNPSPSAGGAKLGRSRNVSVRDSTFSSNLGTGLWFDESVYDSEVTGSRITDNTGNGLALEISGTAKVADNVIADNDGAGVKINDTDHVDVWNNTLTGNGRSVWIAQDGRDVDLGSSYRDRSLPLTLRSEWVTLRNNILASPNASADCMVCVEDYSHRFSAARMHISSDGNLYQRKGPTSPRWLVVWSRGSGDPAVFLTMASVRSGTGQEDRGRLLEGTPALTERYDPTPAVSSRAAGTAYPVPSWVADAAQVPTGTRHLGAWPR